MVSRLLSMGAGLFSMAGALGHPVLGFITFAAAIASAAIVAVLAQAQEHPLGLAARL
jgi:hypothetical protein